MAGDASLGITPVMKWNFERSCYRWLVTRHPAQFERLDFTAQILQSASRARKAFYECGWAEAKVLIRPSDGKFERTPFFDAIIRRGLRNSTRFDAATLTEDEIEALGMHRDETLGFKLQIRHFRSSRKELPPQGRGGGAVRKAPLAPLPTPPPQAHRHGGGPAAAGARHLLPPSIAPPPAAGAGNGRDRAALLEQQQQQQRLSWGAAEAVAAAAAAAAGHPSGDLRWADEARWHHAAVAAGPGAAAGALMDGSNNNNGGGGGERWAAWDGGNRWMPGEEGAGPNADDGHRLRHAGRATPPVLPGLAQAPSPAAAGVTASRRSAAVWEGAPHGGGWVGGPADMRLQGSSWHPSGGASGAAEGRGQGYERMARSGMGEGAGVARDAFAGDRRHQHQQPEVDVRGGGGGGGLRFHPSAVEHQQHHAGPSTRTAATRVVGGSAVPAPSFRHGAVGVDPAPAGAGGTSADPSSVAAGGSLLSQGYRRLAAMAEEQATTAAGGQLDLTGGRRGGGAHPPPPPPAAVLNRPPLHHSPIGRPPLPHEYDAAVAERETDHHKRSASSLVGAGSSGRDPAGCSPPGERGGPRHGQVSREPPFSSLAGGNGPAAKRRRPSVDGGDRPFGDVMQQQQQQQQVRGRSASNERLTHGNGNAALWSRGASGSGTPPPPATALVHDDVLARELQESERELLSSRVAVDLAQARYEEASRTHHAKREQVLAAAAEHQKQLSIAASHHHQGQEQQQQQQQQQTAILKGSASLHSLTRSSEVAAETSAPTARATAGDGRHGAANDGRGSGSEERRNGDADAVFHHRDSPPLGRRSPAAPGRSERPSEAYGRSPTLEAPGAGSASPVGKVSSSPSPSAAGQAQPDCADEMMEVKLEAALLCGMGRAPVSSRQLASAAAGAAVTPSPKAVTSGAEKGLEIVSLAAAAASAVASSSGDGDGNGGVPPRSSSSSPGGIRRGLSEPTHSPLPSLPWKGGHHNNHHHHHHHHHRSAMGQAPGSPSACGETDSDHSSDRGCAAVEDLAGSKKQQHHKLQRPVAPRAVGRGGAGRLSWADYSDGSGDRRAPSLAKLTADVLV